MIRGGAIHLAWLIHVVAFINDLEASGSVSSKISESKTQQCAITLGYMTVSDEDWAYVFMVPGSFSFVHLLLSALAGGVVEGLTTTWSEVGRFVLLAHVEHGEHQHGRTGTIQE